MFSFSQKRDLTDVSPEEWIAAGLKNCVDKYLARISHYGRKMESILPRDNSPAHNAATVASEMSEAIFSRISTLREPKTTKQTKQRALVDLFKCLKEQGYSSMKWSVPSSIRSPPDMLQLPLPSFDSTSSWDKNAPAALEKAEKYFCRSQVEITRLRHEISMFGSQYMSQREMALMQGYSEYILFMICQQRSMIASVICQVQSLESCLQSYDKVADDTSLPLGQKELSKSRDSFEKSLLSLIENGHAWF